jgi:hypothetical protein
MGQPFEVEGEEPPEEVSGKTVGYSDAGFMGGIKERTTQETSRAKGNIIYFLYSFFRRMETS